MIGNRGLYEAGLRVGGALQQLMTAKSGQIEKLPYPFDGWTRYRDLPPLAKKSFIRKWQQGGNK